MQQKLDLEGVSLCEDVINSYTTLKSAGYYRFLEEIDVTFLVALKKVNQVSKV